MNVLSNITQQSNVDQYGEDPHPSMFDTKGHTRSGTGFTLLQGHIQLMAMVPNLPENQTSPRWKEPSSTEDSQLPITPRLMPSASKFKRPRLPSILANKACRGNAYQSFVPPSWHQPPRSLSNSSLPPKHSQPITMPSFARCLPGTKRAIGHGIAIMPGGTYPNADGDFNTRIDSNTSSFPIIPIQPSFQTPVQILNKGNSQPNQIVEQQHDQIRAPTTAYLNPYTGTWLPPQMAYQMLNVVPSQHQQQCDYIGGSGDSAMASMMQQIQYQQQQQQIHLQQQQQTYEQATMGNPYYHYPHQIFGNDLFQYSQQMPYAVQSMPCFGTPCTSPNMATTFATHDYSMSTAAPSKAAGSVLLPPIPSTVSPQPVYSASMPEICFSTVSPHAHHQSHHHHHHHREQLPVHFRKSKKGILAPCIKKEVAIVVEDTTSSTSSSSSEEDRVESIICHQNKSGRGSKSISVLKLREIQKEKEEKKEKEEAKYADLGPESDPGKIPSNPRVAHTPVRVPPPPPPEDSLPKKENYDDGQSEKVDRCSEECCAHCKCCQKNITDDSKAEQQPQILEEKVRELKNKLTPRRKGKPVVVALHDCFPSDSSVTEVDSDVDLLARRSCFNYTGNSGAMVRKRKPRIDAILKTRLKGDSSEVFDDLENDLNPDEARTYTCDYLVELLTSEDWNNCYNALQIMVRLARHRPKVLLNYLSGPILWCTFRHITSPKSALCRAAIVTFKELFQRIGSALDNDLEKITEKLVLKSLAPNMFIREECDRALEAMVNHCNLVKVLSAMEIVTKRPHARAAGHRLARMAQQIVHVAGVDTCLKQLYAEKLLPMLFGFMTEANNGTRTAAKEALGMLMNHLQFETAVTRHVTFDKNCTEVFKKLDKMRGRNRSRRQLVGNARFPLPHAHFRR